MVKEAELNAEDDKQRRRDKMNTKNQLGQLGLPNLKNLIS